MEKSYSSCGFGRFGKVGRISKLSSKNQRERSMDTTKKGDEFTFPAAAHTAKLSRRDHDFQEPTPRREQTVRSEDFSRELQGEVGESQPTESTNDAEVRVGIWSIQDDFIHRHSTESRLQLYVSKEESLSITLKYIDVTRSSYTDLDVM